MDKAEEVDLVSADRPLADPSEDSLGYAPFAKNIAESICKMVPAEGFVIAIYGSWGSGKTTLLNFVEAYLKQKPAEEEQPVIIRFNPWWFSGQEDLTRRFFALLETYLRRRQVVGKQVLEEIASLAELVSKIPIPELQYAGFFARLARKATHEENLPDLKTSIAAALRTQSKRILIIIDDIDRLTAEEVRQLFRVVKAVADFPKITYLLAFDREVVTKALEGEQGRIPGEAYLDKIVQLPFDLPIPDRASLRRLIFSKLDTILTSSSKELFDQTYWANVYFDGIDRFISTPRDIVRLANALSVSYPAVAGEVNPVDFIAIETLRIFCPLSYDMIRKNPDMFAGHTSGDISFSADYAKQFHDSWIKSVPEDDRTPITRLLLRLFPKLEAVWGHQHYGPEWESTWRKGLRVCAPELLPVYFRLAIPEGSLSNAEMTAILAEADDSEEFGARLVQLSRQLRPDGTTRVRAFLERLEDYTAEEIRSEAIPSIFKALFAVGDQLLVPEDEQRGILDFGNDMRMGRVIFQLLRRLDEPQRFKALKDAISQGQAISTVVHEVATLGQQHGRYGAQPKPEGEWYVNAQHLKDLEELGLEKIRQAAKQRTLLHAKDFIHILYRWEDWANKEEVRQWINEVTADDKTLAVFVAHFLVSSFRQTMTDRVGTKFYKLDYESLAHFLELPNVIERIKRIADDPSFTEQERIAARELDQQYGRRTSLVDKQSVVPE
jgi:predicted KAP-like P-loop ATPase